MVRRRLDVELVRRGLVETRQRAQEAIRERRVMVSGVFGNKAARLVDPSEPLLVASTESRFVSRGGHKLAAALQRFELDCEARRVIDAGSSTGGFTDCLLQNGAAQVVAIDVGRNQLHERLRVDPRVEVYEQTNIRYVEPHDVGGAADLVVADLSFISLRVVAPALLRLLCDRGDLVVLVKPQFEAGKAEASKAQGIIRDPAIWHRTLSEVAEALISHGGAIIGAMASPLTGGDGNVEFLLHARRSLPANAPMSGQVAVGLGDVAVGLRDVEGELLNMAVGEALEIHGQPS